MLTKLIEHDLKYFIEIIKKDYALVKTAHDDYISGVADKELLNERLNDLCDEVDALMSCISMTLEEIYQE
ncbi:hypothetical protein [Campylobacter pinnipediorum]|uniref:Uncharacterized protein n=1 Tax=Campylobacter pinnipediorum subsp. pinnipediorum TaxID=1660067 RepID=A0AAX0L8L8_9BACT|nr:hypothetical protein [Campylobacter pinnipediorum]AQW81248.1 hypothetical protein CPIN17260_0950 [Campylobacter pinnipediorum subsp. pinnipediorum]AQW82867.1 hypothetical protein CPIN17261_0857 [Campylobacter pinnipediorum subsp. pinnipediorum]OPA77209.1 hypothetical protein BFG04_03700 [Campylobacter pinnipediorum subsp. pinnipediorum]